MNQHQATTTAPSKRPRRRVRVTALAALVLAAGLVGGCSKDDGGGASSTTTAGGRGDPSDALAQQKAMESAERVLSTVRLAGASGFYAKTTKACPPGDLPQASRPDRSTVDPDEVVTQLTGDLESQGWTHRHVAEGKERYEKDPYVLVLEISTASEGGSSATVAVTDARAACS